MVLGGGDSAFDWALTLQPIAQSVLMIHRSTNFRASKASINKMEQLCANYEMQFLCGQVVDYKKEGDSLSKLIVQSSGLKRTVDVDSFTCYVWLITQNWPHS